MDKASRLLSWWSGEELRFILVAVFGSVLITLFMSHPCAGEQNATAPEVVSAHDVLHNPLNIQDVSPEKLQGLIETVTKDQGNLRTSKSR